MPKISEFFGILIYMYFDDHAPPHFHVTYGEYEALISVDNLSIMKGNLPPRALGLVVEWASQHGEELRENWNKAISNQPLSKIAPLK